MSDVVVSEENTTPSGTIGRGPKLMIVVLVIAVIAALLYALFSLIKTGSAPPPSESAPPVAEDRKPTVIESPNSGAFSRPARDIPHSDRAKYGAVAKAAIPDVEPIRLRLVQAHSAGPASTDAPKRLTNVITWNYWLDGGSSDVVPNVRTGPLSPGVSQRLLFRLSNFDLSGAYPLVKALAGSPELLLAIREGLSDPGRATLPLEILVQSVDPQRVQIAAKSTRIPIVIDLKAMRAMLADPAVQLTPGETPDERVLAAATIAQFGIEFVALTAGTHQIGVAMLDAISGLPLQSMIVNVTVGQSWPGSVSVHANGQAVDASEAPPSDLSLILFDLESTASDEQFRSLNAVLYYRNGTAGHDFLTWRTGISLPGLIDFTSTFRKTIGSVDSGSELLDKGYGFGSLLFDPGTRDGKECVEDRNCADARRARAVILAAANYSAQQLPPSMLVRIISSSPNGTARYASEVLPIGAMGVSLDGPQDAIYLGERFALALILTDQQFGSGATCPSKWYVALPRDEDYPAGNSSDALTVALAALGQMGQDPRSANYVRRQSANLAELKQWLGDTTRADAGPYVFSYLGHHDDGRLFLKQKGPGIDVSNIRRDFGSSSIAILNACNSAMSHVTDGTPVGRLARQRVASTIATTSEISGYLAAAYVDCLNAVLSAPVTLTVGQAHVRATQCLWSEKQSARWGKSYAFQGAALKYILIGNPHQRICAPPKEKQR